MSKKGMEVSKVCIKILREPLKPLTPRYAPELSNIKVGTLTASLITYRCHYDRK